MTCSCDIAVPGWAEGAARDPLGFRYEQLSGLGRACGGGRVLVGVGVDGPLRLIRWAWRLGVLRS